MMPKTDALLEACREAIPEVEWRRSGRDAVHGEVCGVPVKVRLGGDGSWVATAARFGRVTHERANRPRLAVVAALADFMPDPWS